MTASATKTARHEPNRSTRLPTPGAATGATPKTRVSREKYFAASRPE